MGAERRLVVNADDLGQSHGINCGIAHAFQHGILRSASLMVRWPWAAEAAAYSHANPGLGVGLHCDFRESVLRDDEWVTVYQLIPDETDWVPIAEEVYRQLDAFRDLMGRDPTHLDSHQHVHRRDPLRSVLIELAQNLGVVLRSCTPEVQYRGDFYGQAPDGQLRLEAISAERLIAILRELPPGITELSCHPALETDLNSMYGGERLIEADTLCHPDVLAAIESEGIQLCSFAEVRPRAWA